MQSEELMLEPWRVLQALWANQHGGSPPPVEHRGAFKLELSVLALRASVFGFQSLPSCQVPSSSRHLAANISKLPIYNHPYLLSCRILKSPKLTSKDHPLTCIFLNLHFPGLYHNV